MILPFVCVPGVFPRGGECRSTAEARGVAEFVSESERFGRLCVVINPFLEKESSLLHLINSVVG